VSQGNHNRPTNLQMLTNNTGSVADSAMDEEKDAHDAVLTDYSYESHYSQDSEDWTSNDEIPISDRLVLNSINMGEAITFAFPVNVNYDVDDERHMFDEDLSDDESSDSDLSSNYEELMDFDNATHVVIVKEYVKAPGQGDSDDDLPDGDEEYNTEEDLEDGVIPSSDYESSSAVDEIPGTELPSGKTQAPVATTLHELYKADLHAKKQEHIRDLLQSRVNELREMLRQVERELPEADSELTIFEENIEKDKAANKAVLEVSGLSLELFEAYKEFCESLHPEFGLRDGFSIYCDAEHSNSYVQYDPEFEIFKESVERDYKMCNFRSEASGTNVVEFWPIRCPEPSTGIETTWGEQYVSP
jgi:hypothetical protein